MPSSRSNVSRSRRKEAVRRSDSRAAAARACAARCSLSIRACSSCTTRASACSARRMASTARRSRFSETLWLLGSEPPAASLTIVVTVCCCTSGSATLSSCWGTGAVGSRTKRSSTSLVSHLFHPRRSFCLQASCRATSASSSERTAILVRLRHRRRHASCADRRNRSSAVAARCERASWARASLRADRSHWRSRVRSC